jgi:hypothetical protein
VSLRSSAFDMLAPDRQRQACAAVDDPCCQSSHHSVHESVRTHAGERGDLSTARAAFAGSNRDNFGRDMRPSILQVPPSPIMLSTNPVEAIA